MSEIRTNILVSGEVLEYRSNIKISIVTLNENLKDTHSSFRTNIDISTTLKDGNVCSIKTILEISNVLLDFYLVDMTKLNQSILYFSKFLNMNFEQDVMWNLLNQGTNQQINITHLSNALSNYIDNSSFNNVKTNLLKLEDTVTRHVTNDTIHLNSDEKNYLKYIMEDPPWANVISEELKNLIEQIVLLNNWFGIDENGDVYVKNKDDGAPRNFYSFGEVSSGGVKNESSEDDTGEGLIKEVFSADKLGTITEEDLSQTFSAFAIDSIYKSIKDGLGSKTLGGLSNVDTSADAESATEQLLIKSGSSWTVRDLSEIALNETKLGEYLTTKGYITKTVADGAYAPLAEFNALNTKVTDFFSNEADVDTTINRWKELEEFLKGYKETSTLADLLKVKADKTSVEALEEDITTIYSTITDLEGYIGQNTVDITSLSKSIDSLNSSIESLDEDVATNKSSITNLNEKYTTLSGYFDGSGNAKNALKLGGVALGGLFTSLTSSTTNVVSIKIGGVTKNITQATMRNSLGLGTAAYKAAEYFATATDLGLLEDRVIDIEDWFELKDGVLRTKYHLASDGEVSSGGIADGSDSGSDGGLDLEQLESYLSNNNYLKSGDLKNLTVTGNSSAIYNPTLGGTIDLSKLLGSAAFENVDYFAEADAITAVQEDIEEINNLFSDGSAKKAIRLTDNTSHTIWGQTFWSNGVPKSVSGAMDLGGYSISKTGHIYPNGTGKTLGSEENKWNTLYVANISGLSSLSMTGPLTVKGATTLFSLKVQGVTTFTGKTTHNGGLEGTTGTFSSTLNVAGAATFSNKVTVGKTETNAIYFGDSGAKIWWDSENNCVRTNFNFAADGEVSSGGIGEESEDSTTTDYLPLTGGTVIGDLNIGDASNTGKDLNLYGSQYFWYETTPTKGVYLFLDTTAGDRLALRNVDNSIDAKFFVYGNIYYRGTSSQLSDMHYKNVIEDITLSSEVIANAPLFKFIWKDSKDDKVYIGSSAQYWQKVAPELTPLVDDYLTLDYATLGVMIGKSNATEIEQLKLRVKELENEVTRLKGGNYDNI